MDKSQSKKKESGLFGKGQRYWSVMLVGEHGRIVPFHRFKEVALAVIGLAILSLSALLVLTFLYIQQGKNVARLENELGTLRQEASRLRDEKDVLKAKLVRQEIATAPHSPEVSTKSESTTSGRDDRAEEGSPQPSPTAAVAAAKKTDPPKTTPAPVKWSGDIKMFSVDYSASRKILETKFRIYNTSVPKKQLSGRIVVVYKNSDDPPIKWLAVPHSLLKDGKPAGEVGKPFAVRNYRTMSFKAYGIPGPIKYNIVTVYVIREGGELLLTRDFGITIEPEPTPTATPKPSSPTPTPEPSPTATPEAANPKSAVPTQSGSQARPSGGTSSTTGARAPQANSPSEAGPSAAPVGPNPDAKSVLPDGAATNTKEQNNPESGSDSEQIKQLPQTKPEGDGQ